MRNTKKFEQNNEEEVRRNNDHLLSIDGRDPCSENDSSNFRRSYSELPLNRWQLERRRI